MDDYAQHLLKLSELHAALRDTLLHRNLIPVSKLCDEAKQSIDEIQAYALRRIAAESSDSK